MRIIFAGTPDFAAANLQALIDSGIIPVAVYSQPDRPKGRGKKLIPTPVKAVASAHDIAVLQPVNFKAEEDLAILASHDADLMIVVAYGLLLPKAVLETPKLGCINVHASLLPRWRGAAPIERAIEAGDTVTGVTIMQMDEGLDTGNMLSISECLIDDQTTGDSLRHTLQDIGAKALIETVKQLSQAPMQGDPQDDSGANYAKKTQQTRRST
jgi:methionyl-tRNA formyltransferase